MAGPGRKRAGGTTADWLWIVGQHYDGQVKPLCPCDAGRPQDCKPEKWGEAHTEKPLCRLCGHPIYAHFDLRNCPKAKPATARKQSRKDRCLVFHIYERR